MYPATEIGVPTDVIGVPTDVGVRIHVEVWRDLSTGELVIAGGEPGLEHLLLWVHPDSASALRLLSLLAAHGKVPQEVLVDWPQPPATTARPAGASAR